MIKLTIKDRDHQKASAAADIMYQILSNTLGHSMLLSPITPAIGKIRDRFLRELYLKIGREKNIYKIKQIILEKIIEVVSKKEFKTIAIIIDVDPN
jgi:primosomal protein N' (replication factor Y)